MSQLGSMLLFALCVAVVFGTLVRDRRAEQLRLAAQVFGGLVVGALAIGWLMYALFR